MKVWRVRNPMLIPVLPEGRIGFRHPCKARLRTQAVRHAGREMMKIAVGTPPAGRPNTPELSRDFVSQDTGNEWLITLNCPGFEWGGGQGVELIGVLSIQVHAGLMLSVGGTPALTPALSRLGEGEFSATRRQGGRARWAWRLAVEILEMRGGFVPQDAGGEMVTQRYCPEIGGERLRAKC